MSLEKVTWMFRQKLNLFRKVISRVNENLQHQGENSENKASRILINYPIYIVFSIIFAYFVNKLGENEIGLSIGIYCTITGMWGVASGLFLFRIPVITAFIYEKNNRIKITNIILILLGVSLILYLYLANGVNLFASYLNHLLNALKLS